MGWRCEIGRRLMRFVPHHILRVYLVIWLLWRGYLAMLDRVENEPCQGPWQDALGLPWPTRHKHIHVQKKAPIT